MKANASASAPPRARTWSAPDRIRAGFGKRRSTSLTTSRCWALATPGSRCLGSCAFLQHVCKTALQVPEKQASDDERRYCVRGNHSEFVQTGDAVRQQALAIGVHQERQRIETHNEPDPRRDLLLGDEDRRQPEPKGQQDREHLRGVA